MTNSLTYLILLQINNFQVLVTLQAVHATNVIVCEFQCLKRCNKVETDYRHVCHVRQTWVKFQAFQSSLNCEHEMRPHATQSISSRVIKKNIDMEVTTTEFKIITDDLNKVTHWCWLCIVTVIAPLIPFMIYIFSDTKYQILTIKQLRHYIIFNDNY